MIVITGNHVSTVTLLLAALAAFVLFALSLTFHAANVNVLLHAAFAVYVNLYVIQFVTLHVTALLLNVTTLFVCVIAPLVKLNVFIHAALSVHLNVTVHVLYHATNDIGLLLGCTSTLQLGFVLSIFVTFSLQLAVFHARSLTVHVCTPFALTLNVFVLP